MGLKNGYVKTELGLLPSDWDLSTVEAAFDICNNLRLPISEEIRSKMQGKYPYYGPTKIQDYINEFRVEGEFALIGEDGDHFLKWNEMPMTQITAGKFNVNNHAHLIKGKSGITTTMWFYFLFNNRDITKYLTRQGAGRYKLTKATLAKIPCPIPAVAEQTAIATALSDADALINSLEKLIAKKRNIKQGAIQELLKPKKGWMVKRLGDFLDYEQPTEYLVHDTEYHDNNQTPVLTAGKTFILGYTNENFGIFKKLPVIIFDDFTTAIKYVDFPFKAKSSAMKMLKPKNDKVDLRLIYEIMKKINYPVGDHKRHWIGEFQNIKISVPKDATDQEHLANILSDMELEIDSLESKLSKYKQIKAGMMQNLLTGKIRLL